MKIEFANVIASTFKEHPIVDYRTEEPHSYDISALNFDCEPDFRKHKDFDLQSYCECLIKKLIDIPLMECRPFVEYQCKKVKDAYTWLKQLESLIDYNQSVFAKENCRYAKLYAVLETLSEKFQTSISVVKQFDFKNVKLRLESVETFEEKLKVLIEEKTDFLQCNTHNANSLQDCFIKKIDLEIAKISDLQSLSGHSKGQINNLTISGMPQKLKLNGNINVMVDAFYQAMRELTIDGKPYIDSSIKEVAETICAIFADRNGQDLSLSTVQTMLSPAKFDKRPKAEKRLKLSNS